MLYCTYIIFEVSEHHSYIYAYNLGSKDNISAMVVKLSGAVLGPESNGGVDKRREERAGYAMNNIDENPPFSLNPAPVMGGYGNGNTGGALVDRDDLVALMMASLTKDNDLVDDDAVSFDNEDESPGKCGDDEDSA